jgi:hypothetical protein
MKNLERDDTFIRELQHKFKALGDQIEKGDESELLFWVIRSQLACSHRPLRHNRLYGGSLRNLDVDATNLVKQWVGRVRADGIRSIICLMSADELKLYDRLDLGAGNLMDFYARQGFSVAKIPWEDPAHIRRDLKALQAKEQEVCKQALQQFDALPKPVLLHCSAGIDRSSPVAAFIRQYRTT